GWGLGGQLRSYSRTAAGQARNPNEPLMWMRNPIATVAVSGLSGPCAESGGDNGGGGGRGAQDPAALACPPAVLAVAGTPVGALGSVPERSACAPGGPSMLSGPTESTAGGAEPPQPGKHAPHTVSGSAHAAEAARAKAFRGLAGGSSSDMQQASAQESAAEGLKAARRSPQSGITTNDCDDLLLIPLPSSEQVPALPPSPFTRHYNSGMPSPPSVVPTVPSRLGPGVPSPTLAAMTTVSDLPPSAFAISMAYSSAPGIICAEGDAAARTTQCGPQQQQQQQQHGSGEDLTGSPTAAELLALLAGAGSGGDGAQGSTAGDGPSDLFGLPPISAPATLPARGMDRDPRLRRSSSRDLGAIFISGVRQGDKRAASAKHAARDACQPRGAAAAAAAAAAADGGDGGGVLSGLQQRESSRTRAHTYHGYQLQLASAPAPLAGGRRRSTHAGSQHPQPPLPHAAGQSMRAVRPATMSLVHSRTQALELIPLPAKLPEVRQTWRQLCAANWPLLPQLPRACSTSYDAPRPAAAAAAAGGGGLGPLQPHPEAEGDEEEPAAPPSRPQLLPAGSSKALNKGATLLFRGCRVRMGLHTGIPLTTDVTFNRTTGHMAYSGLPLKTAKAVGDCAAGGSVLLSNTTFSLVAPHLAELPGHAQALYCGDAQVGGWVGKEDDRCIPHPNRPDVVLAGCPGTPRTPPCCPDLAPAAPQIELSIRSLYMLVGREQQPRLGYLPPLRNLRLLQHGNLEAPTGTVAICFMTVAGATKAVAELGQPAVSALQQFKTIVTHECYGCGGFVVEATDGLCLAAFMEPAAGAIWALRCKEAITAHSWSREVLSSPHFQEVKEYTKIYRGRGLPSRRVAHVLYRGPRIRTGIAVGPVTAEVSSSTARLAYRGKVMNRSARVASKAADNQVLLSYAAWQRVVATVGLHALAEDMHPGRNESTGGRQPTAGNGGGISPAAAPTPHPTHAGFTASGGTSPTLCASPMPHAGGAPLQQVPSATSVSGIVPAAAAAAAPSSGSGAPRNLLLMAAAALLHDEGDPEEAEALLAAAAEAVAALPSLPAGFALAGSSAGVFTLKGVPEPQELFEVRMEAAPPAAAASRPGGAAAGGSDAGRLAAAAVDSAPRPDIPSPSPSVSTTHTMSATFTRVPSHAAQQQQQPLQRPDGSVSASSYAAAAAASSSQPGGAIPSAASGGAGSRLQRSSQEFSPAAAAARGTERGTLRQLQQTAPHAVRQATARAGEAAPAGLADPHLHTADSVGAMHEAGGEDSVPHGSSVLGKLDSTELAQLRAAAEEASVAGWSAAAVDPALAACGSVGGSMVGCAETGLGDQAPKPPGDTSGAAAAVPPKKPLAGDALLEAMVAAMMQAEEEGEQAGGPADAGAEEPGSAAHG
ncbi:hypothetical protein Agub_g12278, partial [Astrephomene gubernaculifera]